MGVPLFLLPRESIMRIELCCIACSLTLSGCAAVSMAPHQVKPGERISIDYTCRTPDGELAATTHQDVAEDKGLTHSPFFISLATYLPASQTAPPTQQGPPLTATMSFEEMLEMLIARQAVGKPLETPETITVAGDLIPGISGGDRYLGMNRTYNVPRKKTIPITHFTQTYNAQPEAGKEFNSTTPGITVTVESIDGDQVSLCYNAKPGSASSGPFGANVITQADDTFEIKTDAKLGTIVRSSGMIGKITEVSESTFKLDYGHSTGFTPLTCDVVFKPFTSPDGLAWFYDLDLAKEESRKTGKPLLIHFHDQWSGPNRNFLAKVLTDPKVVVATSEYIRVQVNASEQRSKLKKYEVMTIPSVLIVNSQDEVLQRFTGLPDAEKFAAGLQKFLSTPVPVAQ